MRNIGQLDNTLSYFSFWQSGKTSPTHLDNLLQEQPENMFPFSLRLIGPYLYGLKYFTYQNKFVLFSILSSWSIQKSDCFDILFSLRKFLKIFVSFSTETLRKPSKTAVHLWEFLLDLLLDENCGDMICWINREAGEFKLKNQEEVARRWGCLKHRPGMNYDKLSRALRYYYQKGIIKKV